MKRLVCVLASVAGLLLMSACGDGGTSPTTPTTQPTPPPPQVVLEGNFNLPVGFVTGGFFTTTRAGNIVANVDYTFANSEVLVWIAQGQCFPEQFDADACTFVATSFAGGDPRSVGVIGAAVGPYTFLVYNGGPADEAFSVQVIHTPTAASASREGGAAASGGSWRGRAPIR